MRFLIAQITALNLSIGIFANGDKAHSDLVFIEDFERPQSGGLYQQLDEDTHLEVTEGVGVDGSRGLKATFEGGPRGSEREGPRRRARVWPDRRCDRPAPIDSRTDRGDRRGP